MVSIKTRVPKSSLHTCGGKEIEKESHPTERKRRALWPKLDLFFWLDFGVFSGLFHPPRNYSRKEEKNFHCLRRIILITKKKKNARKRRKGGVSAVRFKHQCTDRRTILLFFFFFFTTQQNFSGPQRKLYLPSGLLTTADIPSYLDGKLAGDYGFDPLGLGADGAIKQYRVAEVIHARWAMLAVPGIVIPEALNVAGGDWRETGKVFLEGSTGRFGPAELWLGIAVAPLIVLMGGAEKFRSDPASAPSGFVPFKGSFTGSDFAKLDPINPGGPLDFYNVAATPQDLEILKVKEIKNGRLAMIAMLGVFVQGATTGEGPAANWGKHVADPFGYNFVTLNAVDRTPVL